MVFSFATTTNFGKQLHPKECEEGSTTKRRRRPSRPTRKGGEGKPYPLKGRRRDRHSTELNLSQLTDLISIFCLKKVFDFFRNQCYFDLQGRKINFTNSKTLVGVATDRKASVTLPAPPPSQKKGKKNKSETKKKRKIQKEKVSKIKRKKKKQKRKKITNKNLKVIFSKKKKNPKNKTIKNKEKTKNEKKREKRKEASKEWYLPRRLKKKRFFQKEMLEEIVQQLRLDKNQMLSSKK